METLQIFSQDGQEEVLPAPKRNGAADPAGVPARKEPDNSGSGAAPPPADALYLPDGTVLKLTLSRKIWLGRLFGRAEDDAWIGPESPLEQQTVLYLSGNPHTVWQTPGREDAGPVRPLILRPRAFQEAMDIWLDEKMPDFSLDELKDLAGALWEGEHATQVIALAKKKEGRMTMTGEVSALTGVSNS